MTKISIDNSRQNRDLTHITTIMGNLFAMWWKRRLILLKWEGRKATHHETLNNKNK